VISQPNEAVDHDSVFD